jgi:hypothetical protein
MNKDGFMSKKIGGLRRGWWRFWVIGFLGIFMLSGSTVAVEPMLAAGAFCTVGLRSDGTVVATGDNSYGECNVGYWRTIVAVSVKCQHTVGLKSNGTVVATGYNFYGQCNTSSWRDIVGVAAGYGHTVGLKSNGTVVATGIEGSQCDVNSWSEITAVEAGVNHTLGLKEDGTVVAAGNGSECDVSAWNAIVAVAAGRNFSVGLKSDGTVLATGDNAYNQCTIGSWSNIIAIAAGENHTLGLKKDGTVVATGENKYGQCNVNSWSEIVAIAGGLNQTIGLKSNGMVVVTGRYDHHQFDLGFRHRIVVSELINSHSSGLKRDNTENAIENHNFSDYEFNSWSMRRWNSTPQEKILKILTKSVSEERISADINTLTSFHTRNTYSPLINDVADWIKSKFSQIGYKDIFDHHYTNEDLELRNIIAMKKGWGRTGEVLLICAHYDCRMEELTDAESRAPGADDNASGMASLLEIARIIAKVNIAEDVYFAAFSGEEQGFWGSTAYAQYIQDNNINLRKVINIDMIGYAPNGNSIIIEQDTGNEVRSNDVPSQHFAAKMAQMAADYTDLAVSFGPIYESDYMPFEARGFVCIGAYEAEENPDYHSSNDVVDNLNISSITEVTKMILATTCHEALKLPSIHRNICRSWKSYHSKFEKRRYNVAHWSH